MFPCEVARRFRDNWYGQFGLLLAREIVPIGQPVWSKYSAERHLPPHSALTPRLVPKSQPLDFV